MVTAGYVFEQARALLDDQEETFATNDYLRTYLQMAQDDLVMECMRDPNIGQIKAFVVIPNMAAGTQSLAQELLPGGALALLSDPIVLREKRAGDQDINYLQMIPRLTPIPQTTQNTLNRYYTFTGSDLMFSGANQALDVWVWGSFKPAPIKDQDSPLITDTETILKYRCAQLAARARSNKDLAAGLKADYEEMKSAWMRTLYKTIQSVRVVNRPWRPKTNFWFDSGAGY